MTLKTCGRSGCNPVEQIRGEMKEGDYADVTAAHLEASGYSELVSVEQGAIHQKEGQVPKHNTRNHHLHVELNDANRNDFRICCLTCGKATGWNLKDLPNMPGAGADFVRKQWNGE